MGRMVLTVLGMVAEMELGSSETASARDRGHQGNLLGSLRNDAYEAAVAARREDKARNPDELDEGEKPATADPELANRPLIRE